MGESADSGNIWAVFDALGKSASGVQFWLSFALVGVRSVRSVQDLNSLSWESALGVQFRPRGSAQCEISSGFKFALVGER